MTNQSDFSESEEPLSKQKLQAFLQDKKLIEQLECQLKETEESFAGFVQTQDIGGLIAAHEEICRLVALLAPVWSQTETPAAFLKYYEQESPALLEFELPLAPAFPLAQVEEQASELSETELEKQIAIYAQKLKQCLANGDMEGMLATSELMGKLSEKVGGSAGSSGQELPGINKAFSLAEEESPALTVSDTLSLAKQRAQERNKLEQSASDLFESTKKQALSRDKLRQKLKEYSFYEILALPSTSTFALIHASFIKKIRKLNKSLRVKELELWQYQELMAALCLSHDILRYPNSRLQYDLNFFDSEPEDQRKLIPLKELLKFSSLISADDLSMAIELNQRKPEPELGTYLVEQGKLSVEELDSIMFAQKLVSSGKLTMAQFELAMQELRENSIPILDTLLASDWVQAKDILPVS